MTCVYPPISSPKVAVLLAAYNGEEWIEQQLDSIARQIDVVVHIFISVDFSTDATFEICQKRQNNDARICLLSYGNEYGSAGSNFFRLIRDVNIDGFDYVAFADQDDIWLEDKLSSAHLKILSEDVDCYSSDVIAFWVDGRKKLIKKSFPQKKYDHFFGSAGPGCTYVFKAAAFMDIRYFVTDNYEDCLNVALHDWLIYAFCRQADFKWFVDDVPKMLYRQHHSNVMGANSSVGAVINRFQIIRNGWYKEQVQRIVDLTTSGSLIDIKNRYFLIRNFAQLRRRARDQWALLLIILLGLY